MVFLVPFDGSAAADAALRRAVEHGRALERDVVAVSYVPTGATFAQRRQWIEPTDSLAAETASQDLKRKIDEATDDTEVVYDESSAGSPDDGIGEAVRQTARDVDASVLFVGLDDGPGVEGPSGSGSENGSEAPGGAATGLRTQVGAVTADADYDVYVVRGA